jgi:P-type Ca2+ transporter type 2C
MRRPPRPPSERVITRGGGLRILCQGALNVAITAIAFYAVYRGQNENLPAARTAAFCTLAFAQLMFSFGYRSFRYTLPQLGAFSNPWLLGAIAVSISLQSRCRHAAVPSAAVQGRYDGFVLGTSGKTPGEPDRTKTVQ